MKSNELRIGNYVNCGDTIIFTGDLFQKLEKGKIKVNPILITEGWLFKLGFKKVKNNSYNNETFNIFYDKIDCIYQFTRIEYIHQLQNLYFAMTNKELIIEK